METRISGPNFKSLAAQDPGFWEEVCRLLGDVVFWWKERYYQGQWLAAARVDGEPAVFAGYFGSCSGCDSLEAAGTDVADVARVIQDTWEGGKFGAEAVVAELERLGNEASGEERQACLDAAAALGLSITLMEVSDER